MSAIDTLRNDKDAIIAVLAEHYFLSSQEKKEIEFKSFGNHKCSTPDNIIYHGEWVFCYHRDIGVLYIK